MTLKDFIMMVERQSGYKIRRFQTDNGGEYINQTLKEFFKSQGILHDTITPHSPQSNGVAE